MNNYELYCYMYLNNIKHYFIIGCFTILDFAKPNSKWIYFVFTFKICAKRIVATLISLEKALNFAGTTSATSSFLCTKTKAEMKFFYSLSQSNQSIEKIQ